MLNISAKIAFLFLSSGAAGGGTLICERQRRNSGLPHWGGGIPRAAHNMLNRKLNTHWRVLKKHISPPSLGCRRRENVVERTNGADNSGLPLGAAASRKHYVLNSLGRGLIALYHTIYFWRFLALSASPAGRDLKFTKFPSGNFVLSVF